MADYYCVERFNDKALIDEARQQVKTGRQFVIIPGYYFGYAFDFSGGLAVKINCFSIFCLLD
jgi:hypothetical protein